MVEQPHFDDELTVLTAQPVVPLQQIDAKVKHRRRWFLGGAFVLAMLLGAVSALISAYFKLRSVPQPEIQSLSISSVPEPAVVETPLPIPEPATTTPEDTDKTERRDRPATRAVRLNQRVDQPRLSEEEQLRRVREAVLVEEWQERRQRRVERRERRRAQHGDRDLSNIDEIFEGRRQP